MAYVISKQDIISTIVIRFIPSPFFPRFSSVEYQNNIPYVHIVYNIIVLCLLIIIDIIVHLLSFD